MYSTLKNDKGLQRITFSKKTKLKILLNVLNLNQLQFYFIVRDPYDRIESFFREKFRKSLNHYEKNGIWQVSQEIFFPYLGIKKSMSPEVIKNKLEQTTFSSMVELLPKVYMINGHLHPQYLKVQLMFNIWYFKFKIPISILKTCKLESREELTIIKNIFGIDINNKVNATSLINDNLVWTKQDLKIINELYKEDFERYNYSNK